MSQSSTPPVAKKENTVLTHHGVERIDPYFWMKERDSQPVLDYLQAENAYTKSVLASTEKLQKTLFDEIVGRIKKDDNSVPYYLDGYYYYVRYEGDKEHPFYCRKKESLDGTEEVMVDVNELAKGHSYYQAAGFSISPNNRYLAFGVDTVSRRIYTIRIKDLETGAFLPDQLPQTTSYAVWANDNKTLFYTVKDKTTLRPYRIYKHVLGNPIEKDELIYEEKDDRFTCVASKVKSKEYLTIHSSSSTTDEYRILSADSPHNPFQLFQERVPGVEYALDHDGDYFYLLTNHQAQNFRVMRSKAEATTMNNWEEVVPHREDVLVEDIELFKDLLVVDERSKGLNRFQVIDKKSGNSHYISFKEETYTAYLTGNVSLEASKIRYSFNSLTTPASVIDYDPATKEKTLLKQQEVVGGYEASQYGSERVWAPSHDGTMIPISIVYKKGFKEANKKPLLLYGYGSYGYTIDPYFSSTRLSLLDRGFAFAIAHVRGGEYMGRQWYEEGKFLKKKNTFFDFIACGEYLLKKNYTQPKHLYAMGGSAGGMLMGGVINMSPDLWNGVVAAVPFVDVVTTMLDESIPLTTGEYEEWGNPNEKKYFDYMLSYSPYDQVEAKNYPHLLVTSGYHDSQVQYWEPTKWVAKLRDLKTDENLLLLHTNMDYGHSGASGRFESYKETAMEYAFLFMLEEIEN